MQRLLVNCLVSAGTGGGQEDGGEGGEVEGELWGGGGVTTLDTPKREEFQVVFS